MRLLIFLFCFLFVNVFSQVDSIYALGEVDQLPCYNDDCNGIDSLDSRKKSLKSISNILKNIDYPISALDNDIQGTVFFSYIIRKNGDITDITILKEADKYLVGAVYMRLESLNRFKTPAKKDDKFVSVKVRTSTSFVMQAEFLKYIEPVLTEVDYLPIMTKDCFVEKDFEKAKICSKNSINNFIKNIETPKTAKKKGISGTVKLSFVVSSKTEVKYIKIEDSSGEKILDKAALEYFEDMPKFYLPAVFCSKFVAYRLYVDVIFN